MTREERWIVSVDEIQAIRWECPKCNAAISYPMNQTIRLISNCPSCNEELIDTFKNQEDKVFDVFINNMLKAITVRQRQGGRLKLELVGKGRE